MQKDLLHHIALTLIPGIGSIFARKLIAYAGNVENVFSLKEQDLLKVPRIGESLASSFVKSNVMDKAKKELDFIHKYNIKPILYTDDDYPFRLKQCADAPLILYFKGSVDLNTAKVISIVGTRKATSEGAKNTQNLIKGLTERGHYPIIVSGLAYGIDIIAHKAALEYNSPTVAVLGHGLHLIYPAAHKQYAKQILEQGGGLVTDFASQSIPDKGSFVSRNRIIAGLSDATIVVESAVKGGSMVTADVANSYSRDVYAFPGRVNDEYSSGCNYLIKQNKAGLIEHAEDLEFNLGWTINKNAQPIQKQIFIDLSEDEKIINDVIIQNREINIDQLAILLNLPVSKISPIILNLELKGVVQVLPGKVFKAV